MPGSLKRRSVWLWRWLVIHLAKGVPLESSLHCTLFASWAMLLAVVGNDMWTLSIPVFGKLYPRVIHYVWITNRIAQVALVLGVCKFLARVLQLSYRKYYDRANLRFS